MPHDPFLDQSQDHGGPQMPQLKPGQRLFNRRYELLRPLGAGGMGVVWLARDHTEEIEVALKFLPTVLVLQEGEMKRLREEVRAGKELRHPRLVGTYGMEVEDSIAAIVMEYVSGQTLKEKLVAQGRGFFEPEEIERWVQEICEALDYLHCKAKRIHRDLKPANIIVDAAGEARLMDFGISHRIQEGVSRHSKTSDGEASGSSSTLAYASPQQLSGKPSQASDDLYSLGATLYELLTGTPPFFRGGSEAVVVQIKTEPVTPVMERRQELLEEGLNASTGESVPAAVETTIQACLAKERENRPASASNVIQSFSSPKATETSASSERTTKPDRLKPGSTLAAAPSRLWPTLAALLVLIAAGWGWKTLFKPDNTLDNLPASQQDPEEAARKKVAEEMTAKQSGPLSPLSGAPQAEPLSKTTAEARSPGGPSGISPTSSPPVTPLRGLSGPLSSTKDAPFTNSLGMKFVPVPINAGPSKGQRILFSIWETRSKDYAAFVKDSGHDAGEEWKTGDYNGVPVGRGESERAEDSNHPVANVQHDDAVAFCAWLTKKDRASGLIGPQDEYCLPSDVEWSYAVGIGDEEDASASPKNKGMKVENVYPWNGTYPPPPGSGNYSDTTAKAKQTDFVGSIEGYTDGSATTAPVGSFKANELGLYDLGGNQWEWTSTLYDPREEYFVLRGASWLDCHAITARSSYRANFSNGTRISGTGFRCVLVVGGKNTSGADSKVERANTTGVVPLKATPATTTATKDSPFTNSLGMKFVPVPIGAGPSKDQRVLFSIWETRSKDYAYFVFVRDGSYDAKEDWKTYEYKGVPVGRGVGEPAEDSSHPVANVSHDDAAAFCAWLTRKDRAAGLIGPQDEYRLPSDVEWSYAVGIGEKEDASASPKEKYKKSVPDVYPWGTTFPPPANSGNYADEDAKAKGVNTFGLIAGYHDGHATTAPVGSFQPNGLGIHDLGGNLWEWTSSPWEPGSATRVLRGGSWYDFDPADLLSSLHTNVITADFRYGGVGFRCVLMVSGG